MTYYRGDDSKRCQGCQPEKYSRNPCPNLKETDLKNMEGETYECKVCGEYIFLDYDEMR